MKKYLIMLSAFAVTALMFGCKPPVDDGPTKSTDIKFTTYADAIYHGEELGDGFGYYSITLASADGDKLHLDLIGAVSTNAENAKLTTGEYTLGTAAAGTPKTFFVPTNASDTQGTRYWKNGTESLITGGKLTVAIVSGTTNIKVELLAGETEIKGTFSSVVKLANQSVPGPHPEGVVKINSVWGRYIGKGYDAKAKAGQILLYMIESGDMTNKNTHALQIEGYMPLATDNGKAFLAEGEYTIMTPAEEAKTPEPYKLIAGLIDSKDATGTAEFYADEKGAYKYGWVMSSGTLKVEKVGADYKITATMTGNRADQGGVVNKNPEDIEFIYEGSMDALQNYADPVSNITENKDLGTISNNKTIVQAVDLSGNATSGWLYLIFGDGITPNISGSNLTLSGSDNVIMLFLQGPKSSADLATGEFPMGEYFYMSPDPKNNFAMPGDPYLESSLGPESGCWYAYYDGSSGSMKTPAGAMPLKGSVNAQITGSDYSLTYEFYDRNGHKVSGKFEAAVSDIQILRKSTRALGMGYTPSFRVNY